MNEKRKILELDLDTDKILAKSATLKKQLDQLKESRKQLKKAEGDNSTELAKQDALIKKVSTEYRTATKTLQTLTKNSGDLLSVQQRLDVSINQEIKTINEARQANKDLLGIRNELNLETEKGRKQAELINDKLDKNNSFIKENVSGLEQQKIGIGGYKDAINDAIQENGIFQGQVNNITQVFQSFSPILNQVKGDFVNIKNQFVATTTATEGMTKSQKALQVANRGTIAGLKLLKLALISTGIGAIVVALGTLGVALAQSQRFTDFFTRALAPLKGALGAIIGIVQDLAFNIESITKGAFGQFKDAFIIASNTFLNGVDKMRLKWNEFTGDQKEAEQIQSQINERTKETTKALERTVQRAKAVSDAVGEAGKRIKEGAEAQKQVAELGIEIEKAENKLIVTRSKLNKKIKEANKIAEDVTKTQAEREQAAINSIKLSEQLLSEEQKIIDKKIQRKKIENSINESDREAQRELSELIAERNDKETQALELQTTQTNKLNTIRQQIEGDRRKAIDERLAKENEAFETRIKQMNDELELFIAQQDEKNLTQKQELEVAKEISDRQNEILKERYEQGKLTETEYQIELLQIKKDFSDKQVEIAMNIAEREREIAQQKIETEVQNQIKKNNRLAEVDKEFQAKRLEQGVISQQEYNDAINVINEENRIANKEADKERREFEKELKLELETTEFEAKFQREKERLERQRLQAVQEAQRLGADVTSVNEFYAEQQNKIDEAKFFAKSQMALDNAKGLVDILGRETKVAKAVGLAQAALNLGKAIAQANTVPFPANILAIAKATATGVKAIKDIRGVKQPKAKLARGGILDDPSLPGTETSDSIPARLSKGESVMNARTTKMFRPLLSALNEAGGGVGFARGGLVGLPTNVLSQSGSGSKGVDFNVDELAFKISEANRNLPPQQVAVTDIRRVNSEVSQIEARATHG